MVYSTPIIIHFRLSSHFKIFRMFLEGNTTYFRKKYFYIFPKNQPVGSTPSINFLQILRYHIWNLQKKNNWKIEKKIIGPKIGLKT